MLITRNPEVLHSQKLQRQPSICGDKGQALISEDVERNIWKLAETLYW